MIYYLVGYMGSGKSTLGRKLAKKLDCPFFDTDRMIEERFNLPEFEIFEKYGEELYHRTEVEILRSLASQESAIVSCGGELAGYDDNMSFIQQTGKSIYIKMAPKSLANRLFHARKKRAQIQSYLDCIESLEKFVMEQLLFQEPYFEKSSYCIKGENLHVDDLVQLVTQK